MGNAWHRRARRILRLPIVISVTAVGLAILHVAWPGLKIDSITLGLLAVALLPWLAPLFKTIELPGGFKVEYQEFKQQVLEQLDTSQQKVETLSTRVEQVERAVITGDVTPSLEAKLRDALDAFSAYLAAIGVDLDEAIPTVRVDDDVVDNAYYDPGTHEIVLGGPLADDPDVLFREYAHHVLLRLRSDSGDPGDSGTATLAVESGIADYLVCSYTGDPLFAKRAFAALRSRLGLEGEAVRDLRTDRGFGGIGADEVTQRAGEVWGALLWELRTALGRSIVDPALVIAWSQAADFGDGVGSTRFGADLTAALEARGGARAAQAAQTALERRGAAVSTPRG